MLVVLVVGVVVVVVVVVLVVVGPAVADAPEDEDESTLGGSVTLTGGMVFSGKESSETGRGFARLNTTLCDPVFVLDCRTCLNVNFDQLVDKHSSEPQ